MFLINNTEHMDVLIEVVKDLENAEGNACLKTEDGEEILINQVLLSIVFPSLGATLDRDVLGTKSPVFVLPLAARILKMVLDIKLRGFVSISDEEDVDRIIEASDILGVKIEADTFTKHIPDSLIGIKVEVEDPVDVKVEVEIPKCNENNPSSQKSLKRTRKQKKAGKLTKDRCDKCKFYSKRGALKAHILESHTESGPNNSVETKTEAKIAAVISEKVNGAPKGKRALMGRKCQYCKMDLPRKSLTQHVKQFHPDRDIFKCETCGYECIIKSILIKHIKDVHQEITKCRFCQKEIKFIENHLEKFHPEQLEMHSCTLCPFTAFDEQRLAIHIQKQHESKRGKCGKCNKRFRDIAIHTRKHEINKFECMPCSKSFSVKRDLCRHILYEHEKKRASCNICGKTSVTNLKSHMKFKHPEMANSVEDDERINRDRIAAQLGEAWQYRG